jgi:phage shock protein PspC (stress-responsive transcriptional regulator)
MKQVLVTAGLMIAVLGLGMAAYIALEVIMGPEPTESQLHATTR